MFPISGIQEDNIQDSGRIFTNCHVSGVGLRSTVVASICSRLCLGKVHIVWQKTAESSLLPYSLFLAPAFQPESQATASLSAWGQYLLGSQISPLLLFSFFSLHSWLETWGLSRNCARCVRQHSDMLGCNWWWCAVWDCQHARPRQMQELEAWVSVYGCRRGHVGALWLTCLWKRGNSRLCLNI